MPQVVVLVVGRVRREGLRVLEEAPGVALEVIEDPTPDAIMAAMPGTSAILVRTARIDAAMIEAAPHLRVVSRHGVGYDNVDLPALNRRRIPLALSVNANKVAVAEHTLAMLLELHKQGRAFDQAVKAGDWASQHRIVPLELSGRTLLLLGFGRIGREVATRARAFGMRVAVHTSTSPPDAILAAGCEPAPDLDAALAEAHAVSLHLPLTPATRHVIGEARLAAMRPDAVLVNTSRGGLVDEAALARALRDGRIRAAALDVIEDEPPPSDHPLLALDNCLLSPHVAGTTAEAMARMAAESAENALAGLEGRLDPAVVVNPDTLAR